MSSTTFALTDWCTVDSQSVIATHALHNVST